MDREQAERLMQALGVSNIEARGDQWLNGSCPLAPITHASGVDNSPSFGIHLDDESHYFCFSCGSNGPVSKLLMELQPLVKDDPTIDLSRAHDILQEEADGNIGYKEQPDWTEKVIEGNFEAFPDWWLTGFPSWNHSPAVIEYLKKRGVSPQQANDYKLKYDADKHAVCFPYWNKNGQFAGMRGRYLIPKDKNKYHDYKFNGINNSSRVWYNEDRIDWLKPIVVAEGAFDVLAVAKYYPNVMSPWTCTAKADMLRVLNKSVRVIVGFDGDAAGDLGYDRIVKLVGDTVLVERIPIPEHHDLSSMATDDLKDVLAEAGLLT